MMSRDRIASFCFAVSFTFLAFPKALIICSGTTPGFVFFDILVVPWQYVNSLLCSVFRRWNSFAALSLLVGFLYLREISPFTVRFPGVQAVASSLVGKILFLRRRSNQRSLWPWIWIVNLGGLLSSSDRLPQPSRVFASPRTSLSPPPRMRLRYFHPRPACALRPFPRYSRTETPVRPLAFRLAPRTPEWGPWKEKARRDGPVQSPSEGHADKSCL